ncbi:MAG: exo-alpha-sialidase [Deltaproteobacteria bacterium]|nr:MAG: exo-alpha-sialidase [Deltaproteobacteria bacterium]
MPACRRPARSLPLVCAATLLELLIGNASPGEAFVSFGPAHLVDAGGAADTVVDDGPDIATDNAGVWLSAWISGGNVVAASSSDAGASWSVPVTIDASGNAFGPVRVASNGAGAWIAVWASPDSLGGTIGSDWDILFSISSDAGASWSTPAAVNTNASTDIGLDRYPVVAAAGGTWIVAWQSDDPLGGTIGNDDDIFAARSADAGATWSPPAVLNSDAASDGPFNDVDANVSIATDATGTWILAWETEEPLGGSEIAVVRSVDDGLSWSAQSTLSTNFTGENFHHSPDLATDGAGRWVAVWRHEPTEPGGPPVGQAGDIVFAVSSDNGSSWSDTDRLHPYFEIDRGAHETPRVATDGSGIWLVAWNSTDRLRGPVGGDPDIFYARSTDDALTWSLPAALNTRAGDKSLSNVAADWFPRVAMDANATAVAVWRSTDPLGLVAGDDEDILVATARADCPVQPAAGCRTPIKPLKAKLSIKSGQYAARGNLVWRWSAGQATTLAEFADPTSSSRYALCVYDDAGSGATRMLELDLLAAGTCSGQPCWEQKGETYRYRDKALLAGPVKTATLKAGDNGKARIVLRAKGPTLSPPRLPLTLAAAVTVQMHNLESGVCWQATYPSAKKNTDERFLARSE